jgi:hypothetical protein
VRGKDNPSQNAAGTERTERSDKTLRGEAATDWAIADSRLSERLELDQSRMFGTPKTICTKDLQATSFATMNDAVRGDIFKAAAFTAGGSHRSDQWPLWWSKH